MWKTKGNTLDVYWQVQADMAVREGKPHVAQVIAEWYSYKPGPYDYQPQPGTCAAKPGPVKKKEKKK